MITTVCEKSNNRILFVSILLVFYSPFVIIFCLSKYLIVKINYRRIEYERKNSCNCLW